MRSKAKMKLSLVASCALSLLAVTSASISTFAWFSASADVEIEASTSSTTITVSAPDELEVATPKIYAYNENFTEVSTGVYNNHGYKSDSVNKVSMLWEKGEANMYFKPNQTSSGTNPGYYHLGEEAGQKYSRCVAGNIITIMPQSHYDIDYVEISVPAEQTSSVYMSTILSTGSNYSVTWSNASASSNDDHTLVTLTPVDGSQNISTTLTKPVKFFSFTIYYNIGESDTFELDTDDYFYPINHESNENTDKMAWSTASTPAFIDDDFLELNSDSLKNALLTTSKLAPGYKLTFAIRAQATSNVTSAEFYLEKYTSIRMKNRKKIPAKNNSSGAVPIAMDEAINIYGAVNAYGWYVGSTEDRFDSFSYSTEPKSTTYDSGDSNGNVQTLLFDSEDVSHPYTRDLLGGNEGFNQRVVYFFFTIEFSDENTSYFNEYNKVASDASVVTFSKNDYVENKVYSSSNRYYSYSEGAYSIMSPQPNSSTVTAGSCYTAQDRYFVKETSGNSNCFQGLTFQINRIKLELF